MWIPYSKRPSFAFRQREAKFEEEKMSNGGGHLLDKAVLGKINSFNTVLNSLEIGHSSMQGYRVSMEDACIATTMDDLPDHVVVGILDGHAGNGASEYLSERLSCVISETSHFQEYIKLDKKKRIESVDLLSAALVQAFVDIDTQFLESSDMDGSGSTAVCTIISPSHIICASVGDSRCVVGTCNSGAISLSEDHKPQLADEKKRIEFAGGYVYMGRVNGELAMSRAIGDYQYKDNEDLQCDQQMVSCYPDIAVHVRSSSDQLLVLACDGVWDVMTNVESINFLQEVIQTEDEDMSSEEMAEALIDLAFGSGSTDNISSIVVKLNNTIKAQETMIDSLVNDVKLSKKRKIDEKVIDSIVIETAKLPHKVDKKRKFTP